MSRAANKLPSVFAFDLRGLAALRIGLGLLIIADLINRARSFGAHYGEAGVLPYDVLARESERGWQISVHVLFASDWATAALFVLAAVFAVMLVLGYRSRVAAAVSWFLLISLHTRHPWVLQGGDEVFRALLFWAMFLPLGARFSLDRLRTRPPEHEPDPPTLVSLATVCLVGQVVMLYTFVTLSKLGHSVWLEGQGVYYALGIEQFTTRFGLWMRDVWPPLLVGLNWATLVLQGLVPLALLATWRRDLIRAALSFGMIAFHLSFALSMELGLFSYIVVVMWLAFLPPQVWDWLAARIARLAERRWPRGARLWSRARDGLEARFARRGPLLARLRGGAAADGDRRPPATPPARVASSIPAKVFLGVTFTMVLWWNLWGANRAVFHVPDPMRNYLHVLRLEQRWKMFSSPPRWSQWFEIRGVRADGTELDAFRRGPLSDEKPEVVSSTFPNQRWRKYLNNLARKKMSGLRQPFAAWVCRRWNREHDAGEKLARVELVMYRQPTPHRPGLPRFAPDRAVLGRYPCPAE